MRFTPRHRQRTVLAAVAALATAALTAAPATAAATRGDGTTGDGTAGGGRGSVGPVVRLEAAQRDVTIGSSHGFVLMDPGVWVVSLGSALQFDVQRAAYTKPVTLTQVIHTPWGSARRRPLPASMLDGWFGLKHFIRMTVRDTSGKVVDSPWLTFCPNTYDPERASSAGPAAEPYPQECGMDPFPLSLVWGIAKGWAADPAEDYPPSSLGPGPFMHLNPGKYQVTESVAPDYVKLLHIATGAATATVAVTVVKGAVSTGPRGDQTDGSATSAPRATSRGQEPAQGPGPARVPNLAHPPVSVLPDLVPLPSWGISTSATRSGRDLLDFGATVWVGGNGPLDVEGFRSPGSPIMKAYQYFWRDGRVIGRTRAGIMRYDNQNGHHHWHFEQFARYVLLNSDKKQTVRSHKVGFCIAPSDPVDLLAPHAQWQPPALGLVGQCGTPTSLWVREMMPVGWGDTYFQDIAGQSFNITGVPNGTYYIELAANPVGLLHETATGNDVSLRKVILGGTPGHRTVRVPPWHGIDPES